MVNNLGDLERSERTFCRSISNNVGGPHLRLSIASPVSDEANMSCVVALALSFYLLDITYYSQV